MIRACKMVTLEQCLAAVEAEPELPGDMPDEMWELVRRDRAAATQVLRIVVRQTKNGIMSRILSELT